MCGELLQGALRLQAVHPAGPAGALQLGQPVACQPFRDLGILSGERGPLHLERLPPAPYVGKVPEVAVVAKFAALVAGIDPAFSLFAGHR